MNHGIQQGSGLHHQQNKSGERGQDERMSEPIMLFGRMLLLTLRSGPP